MKTLRSLLNRRHVALLVILTFLPIPWTTFSSFAASDPPGVGRALLIGINKYKAIPSLFGSKNDINRMREVLMTRFGFQDKYITMLQDEEATRQGILDALNTFVKTVGPNDTVYIHYSGHGSQVKDLNGDEKDDGKDETLVPQDGRSGKVRDITDDELDQIFSQLPTSRVFIVLDSCHSGTATRGVQFRTRSIPPDTRLSLYTNAMVSTRAVVPLLSEKYVLMTGAASHQEALDGPIDGRYHGFFTYALSKSLSNAPVSASPREILAGAERELKRIQSQIGRASMPEPQLEAPKNRMDQPLLTLTDSGSNTGTSDNKVARLPWAMVHPTSKGKVALAKAGHLGAVPDSLWAIYPPNELKFVPGKALAVARIHNITADNALASLEPGNATIPDRSRAVLLSAPSTSRSVPVQFRSVPKNKRQQLADSLKRKLGKVEIVGPGAFARFVVDLEGDRVRMFSADGLEEVASVSLQDGKGTNEMAAVVSRSVTATELMTLENPSTQLDIQARVVTGQSTQRVPTQIAMTRGIKVVADLAPSQYHIRRPSEPRSQGNSLQLEIQTNADGYLTIVDVDSEGNVNLLFPNDYQNPNFHPGGFIHGHTQVRIPDSLNSGNQAGFHWDYSPPAGTDTLRLFFSTDADTAQVIRQDIMAAAASKVTTRGGQLVRGAKEGQLEDLRNKLAQKATRGLIVVADEPAYEEEPPATPVMEPAAAREPEETEEVSEPEMVASAIPTSTSAQEEEAGADWTATSVTILISN